MESIVKAPVPLRWISLYKLCNAWSRKIAFLQAIHDYALVYSNQSVGTVHNMESIVKALPPISSMIPPQSLPSEIENDIMLLQKERSNRNNKGNKRLCSSSPLISLQHQQQQEQMQQHQQLLTDRRVRQRVC